MESAQSRTVLGVQGVQKRVYYYGHSLALGNRFAQMDWALAQGKNLYVV